MPCFLCSVDHSRLPLGQIGPCVSRRSAIVPLACTRFNLAFKFFELLCPCQLHGLAKPLLQILVVTWCAMTGSIVACSRRCCDLTARFSWGFLLGGVTTENLSACPLHRPVSPACTKHIRTTTTLLKPLSLMYLSLVSPSLLCRCL